MKKFLAIFILLLFTFVSPAFAVDLSVTCTSSTCSLTPSSGALFNEASFAPGQSVTRTISVQNNNVNDDCYLELKTKNISDPNNLAPVLFTVIKNSTTDIFGKSDGISAANIKKLKDVFDSGYISLGTISKSSSKSFYWVATFDPTVNNDFQGRQTTFDFDMSFTCGVVPAEVLGTSTSSLSCSDATPANPTNFNAVLGANPGQVILSWNSLADPHTYFLVAYSDNSTWPPKWGNPNVGNGTGYTVSGLGTGTYYFWLRAGNGCQPGGYTGPVSVTIASGAAGGGGTAEGFTQGVLGTQDNINSDAATASPEIVNVLGAQTSWWQRYWWLLPLIIFGGLLLWWFLGKMRSLLHSDS